jgi:peroxiredoxin
VAGLQTGPSVRSKLLLNSHHLTRGKSQMLKPGAKAPSFSLKSDDGKTVSLADFAGQRVLLFLYPKANTSG